MAEVELNYAILKSGGKQYRVKPGDVIDVERLSVEEGSSVELADILAVSRDGEITVGNPIVPQASVTAHVRAHDKDKKIIVFKYKRKVRYRRKKGHRQHYTRLAITSIVVNGEEIAVMEEPKPRAALEADPSTGLEEEPALEASAEPGEKPSAESTAELEAEPAPEAAAEPEEEPATDVAAQLGEAPAEEEVQLPEAELTEEAPAKAPKKAKAKPRATRKRTTKKPTEKDK